MNGKAVSVLLFYLHVDVYDGMISLLSSSLLAICSCTHHLRTGGTCEKPPDERENLSAVLEGFYLCFVQSTMEVQLLIRRDRLPLIVLEAAASAASEDFPRPFSMYDVETMRPNLKGSYSLILLTTRGAIKNIFPH